MVASVVLTCMAWAALIFLQRNHHELLLTSMFGNRQAADLVFAFVLPIALNIMLAWLFGLFAIVKTPLRTVALIGIAALLPVVDFALVWRIACFSSC